MGVILVYKPTYIWGGPSCMEVSEFMDPQILQGSAPRIWVLKPRVQRVLQAPTDSEWMRFSKAFTLATWKKWLLYPCYLQYLQFFTAAWHLYLRLDQILSCRVTSVSMLLSSRCSSHKVPSHDCSVWTYMYEFFDIYIYMYYVFTQFPFRCPFEFLRQQRALAAPLRLRAAFAWWDGNVAGRRSMNLRILQDGTPQI